MKRQHTVFMSCCFAGALLAVMAFTGNPGNSPVLQSAADTIPASENKGSSPTARDLDREIRELEQAGKQLKDIDFKKIQAEIEASMKNSNLDNISRDVEKTLKTLDLEIQREVAASLASIDWKGIEKEINLAMEEIDISLDKKTLEHAKAELEKARLDIRDATKEGALKKELESATAAVQKALKEVDIKKEIEKARIAIEMDKEAIEKDMRKAHQEMEAARQELKGYQEMIYSMEAKGLLDTRTDYSIAFKEGILQINGMVQPPAITDQYKHYFKKAVTIQKKNGRLEIDH